ncbi:hypothetical protein EUBDOL_00758 [Amedibacillus dolichus DSM 3991]|uniref:Uncharacterized protein n=1 Tax=Amedibacillus dolichus DSM 3991 TaxID=428127 RepID=A8RAA9_9FIRM|nr:hypothetical protein EUBDOL_00758 [Amedibacillus dolichus DSM 3991]
MYNGGGIFLWREIRNYKFYFESKTSKLELLNIAKWTEL